MILSTQTDNLSRCFSDIDAIKMIAKAGFDAFDLSTFRLTEDENCEFNQDNYIDYAKQLRKTADECNIICNQAHSPYPSSVGIDEDDEIIFEKIVRSMEIASIVGAKIIVVHTKMHLEYQKNVELLKKINIDFYTRLIPYCEKFNIKVALENTWLYNNDNKIVGNSCSRVNEFCEYIDLIDSKWIVGCLDIGHPGLIGENVSEMIKTLGRKRLKALHVHDNDFITDTHTLPFIGKIDFSAVTNALSEIDYDGDFTFESDSFLAKIPKELKFDALQFMNKIGRYLIAKI